MNKSNHKSGSRVCVEPRIDLDLQRESVATDFHWASPDGFSKRLLGDHGCCEGWCSNQGNCATQARVIFRGHDVDLGRAAKLSQRSFTQSTANDWFDQTPRGGYFAADINAPGIESVDDRSKAQTEVTCGGVDRGECFCVACTRTCDQVFDREIRGFGIARSRFRQVLAEVA